MIELSASVLLAAAVATLLMAISKAGFGGGLGALATPILALTVTAPQAVAIMLPLLICMDAIGLWTFRKKFDAAVLRIVLPGAIVGTALGWALFGFVDARNIKLILAIECLLFAGLRLRKGALNKPKQSPKILPGVFFGAMSSLASFISHAGSPPIMQYVLPLKLEKEIFVGTMTVFFTLVNLSKLLPYASLGLLNFDNLTLSALMLPAVPIGFWIGYKLLHRLKQAQFDHVITIAMIVTGFKLLWDALR
jgi:uncharacterized protein